MNCENYMCIYQKNGECVLKEISIDVSGMCQDCIYPNVDEGLLKTLKEYTIKKMENSWQDGTTIKNAGL
ncbi:MAG: hypothetical protein E7525_07215 [Ruminococcaceae bacterium]|nr:hypothetical protein [Oscillospiraceae bacterium]